MVERNYSKDTKNAYQTLTTTIQADKQTVFRYLATTDGISEWFPQLSISEESVLFDMDDGTFEKMSLIDFTTNEKIAYEWATGKVEFQLKEIQNNTKLTFKEILPLNFQAIPEDFTGWYVQIKNIKTIAETGLIRKIDKTEIKQVKDEIAKNLFNE